MSRIVLLSIHKTWCRLKSLVSTLESYNSRRVTPPIFSTLAMTSECWMITLTENEYFVWHDVQPRLHEGTAWYENHLWGKQFLIPFGFTLKLTLTRPQVSVTKAAKMGNERERGDNSLSWLRNNGVWYPFLVSNVPSAQFYRI